MKKYKFARLEIESILWLSEWSLLLFLATLLALLLLFHEPTHCLEPGPFTLDEASCIVHRHLLLNFLLFLLLFVVFILSKLFTPLIILTYQPLCLFVIFLSLLAHRCHLLLLSIHCGAFFVALCIASLRQQHQLILFTGDVGSDCG